MKRKTLEKKANLELFLMCLPTIIKVLIFSYIPMVGLVISFQYYRPADGLLSEFVGLQNFEYLFLSPDARIIIVNTITYNLLFMVFGFLVSITLALFMFQIKRKFVIKYVQTLIMFPFFASWILVGSLVTALLGTDGFLTHILSSMTGKNIAFYSDGKYWRAIMVMISIWKSGGVSAIIYYATLLNIDREIFEAAEIDGAGKFRQMLTISIPMIKTMIIVNTIMSCSNIFRTDFSMFFYPTRGPVNTISETTEVIDTYIYKALLSGRGSIGVGTAIGFLQGVVGLVLTFFMNLLSKKVDPDAALF